MGGLGGKAGSAYEECEDFSMHAVNHNWSARKQHLPLQSVARISCHSALSEDRIWQCGTSSGSRHKDTDRCLQVAIFFHRHHSVPVTCENGSVKTAVAEGGHNPIAGLWGRTLGESWLTRADAAAMLYRTKAPQSHQCWAAISWQHSSH